MDKPYSKSSGWGAAATYTYSDAKTTNKEWTDDIFNWTYGRAFEPNTSASDDSRYHNPIYTIAATTVQEETGWLRAFVGRGDRAHVRSQNGGDCRPDDPMSCISSGCKVTTTLNLNNATLSYSSVGGSTATTTAASPTIASPRSGTRSPPRSVST